MLSDSREGSLLLVLQTLGLRNESENFRIFEYLSSFVLGKLRGRGLGTGWFEDLGINGISVGNIEIKTIKNY